MSKELMQLGSQEWCDAVFRSPPARKVKGRTRWTHRHATWVEHLGRIAYVESRNELIGLIALEYLHRRKLVARFKEQAFTFEKEVFGREYTPDFMAEPISVRSIIEIKTHRFITRELEAEFEYTKASLAERNLQFLVWTDKKPLTRPLRHNLLRLRRASTLEIHPEETARLIQTVAKHGQVPLWALYELDLDIDLVSHACWNGKVFLPLTHQLHTQTTISLSPAEDLASILFNSIPDMHSFWNELEDAA